MVASIQKKIEFSEKVKVRPVTHVYDMKPEVFQKVYYNRKDYAAFKAECYDTATAVARMATTTSASSSSDKSQQQKSSSSNLCTRGIETFISKKVALQRKERIKNARSVVFEEQKDQKEDGINSEEFLAELYEDVTSASQQEAHKRALKDHEDISAYLNSDDVESNSSAFPSGVRRKSFNAKNIMSSFQTVTSKGMMQMFSTPAPVA